MHKTWLPNDPRLTVAAAVPVASFPAILAVLAAAAVAMPAAVTDHVAAWGAGDAPLAVVSPVLAAPLAAADCSADVVAAVGAGKIPCVAASDGGGVALSTGADGAGSGVAAAAAAAEAAGPPRSRMRAFGEGMADQRPA